VAVGKEKEIERYNSWPNLLKKKLWRFLFYKGKAFSLSFLNDSLKIASLYDIK